ncbi:MAG: protein kinase domain-containing protein [Planctomycetales bacterium]
MNDSIDPSLRTQAAPPEPTATAGELEGSTTQHQPLATEPAGSSLGGAVASIPGYRILGEIARGGMGVVLAAHDLSLDREVAIKVLIDGNNSRSAMLRFVRESKIAAKLAHPGIPPIHSLGTLPDGSPYMAMKLIRGQTLAELLEARPSAQADLSRYVQVFEQIAQAVGFAHAQGIIHRDLKPANVMVGEFGEMQVMDWGIAKILGEREAELAAAASPSESDEDVTQAGAVMGTPSCMAPEQARGEPVDARADVFSLGAILCVILTEITPFSGGNSALDTVRMAAAGDVGPALARLDACGADPDLIDLAKRCLAPRQEARPADGREVAACVAAHRADVERRLRDTERQQAASAAQAAEQRKRRRAMAIAGGLLCTVLALGAGISTWQALRAGKAETETRKQLVATELAEKRTRELLETTEEAKREAELARDQARERYLLALSAFDDMVFAIQEKLGSRPGTLEIRKSLLTSAQVGLKKLLAEAERHGNPDQKLVWSYFQMGYIEQLLGHHEAARQQLQAGHDLARRLADAKPDDNDAQRDVGVGLLHLGDACLQLKQFEEAREFFQAKLQIDLRLVAAVPGKVVHQRDLSLDYSRLGTVALQFGQVAEAHALYQKKLQIARDIAENEPANDAYLRDGAVACELVGNSASYLQDFQRSLDAYREMHDIMQRLLEVDPQHPSRQRDVQVSLQKLGTLYSTLGQIDPAVDYFRQAIEILERIAAADPQNSKFQTELFVGYDNLGVMEESRHDYAAAAEWYRQERAVILPMHERQQLVGQYEHALQNVDLQLATCERKMQVIENLDFALQQPAGEIPELLNIRLHVLARRGDGPGVAATAEAYTRLAESNAALRYPAAQGWSLASGLSKEDADQGAIYAGRSVALLAKTPIGKNQFAATRASLATLIKQDAALAPLHSREDFQAFVKSLEVEEAEPQ